MVSPNHVLGVSRMSQASRPAVWVHRITLAGRITLPKPHDQRTILYWYRGREYLVCQCYLGVVDGGLGKLGCGAVEDASGLQACGIAPLHHSDRPDKAAEALDPTYSAVPVPR